MINYSDIISWLFSQLPMYQRIGNAAYKSDLENTLKLAEYLDHPENSFKSVHIAGTNGKGSTSHMLASVLQEAGYTVGLYTSPHLKDFRERIKIDGVPIPKREVSRFVKAHKKFFEANQLSFFEMTVGMAFDHFRKKKVDIAIIEVGLGGRLDSTNIIHPELAVITNIGMDHKQFLGDTIEAIASEKAGIIKTGVPVVIGESTELTKTIFEKAAETKKAPILFAKSFKIKELKTDLLGWYQEKNKRTSLVAIEVLKEKGYIISDEAVEIGLLHVVRNTGLLGRWQILQIQPKVICDTAHNREGLGLVMNQLKSEKYAHLHIVLGVTNDKDLDDILPLFPVHAEYYFCKANIPRGLNAMELMHAANCFGLIGKNYPSVQSAYKLALKRANNDDLIFVGGSTFIVAEVL